MTKEEKKAYFLDKLQRISDKITMSEILSQKIENDLVELKQIANEAEEAFKAKINDKHRKKEISNP
jgi:transcription initiation factor IIF auxiliary subunit